MKSITYRYIPILILSIAILTFSVLQSLKVNFAQNMKLQMKTIEGDDTALNDVTIEGNIIDTNHRIYFNIENGQISKKFFKVKDSYQYQEFMNDRSYFSNEQKLSVGNYGSIEFMPYKNSIVKSKNEITNSDDIRLFNSKTYRYNVDKIQPVISISEYSQESEYNPTRSVFLIPDCYIYSDNFDFKINKRENINKDSNSLQSVTFSNFNMNLFYNPSYKRYIANIDGNIYCTVITDSQFRGSSGIYRVDNFFYTNLEEYITLREKGDSQLNHIDKNIQSNFTKLVDIDLEDGNRCVYGMTAVGKNLAVIVYELKPDNRIEYQLWLFDPSAQKFLSKTSIATLDRLNNRTDLIDSFGETTYFQNYCDIGMFVQNNCINLAFETRSKDFNIFTFDIHGEKISCINSVHGSSSYLGEIQNVFYRDKKTYIQFKDISYEMPVISERATKFLEYARINNIPNINISNSIIEIFDSSQKIYSGQIVTDIEQDTLSIYKDYSDVDKNVRQISVLNFK